MTTWLVYVCIAFSVAMPLIVAAQDSSESTEPTTTPEQRVLLTTSRVVGQPDPPPPFRPVRAYPNFTVRQPIYCEPEPGTENLFVIQHLGGWSGPSKVLRVRDDTEVSEHEVLIESTRLVYGLTFHPDYEHNGYVYLFGNGKDGSSSRYNRISRFTVDRAAPFACDPESEWVILEWDSSGHDGGDLEFGPDGMLYLASGDGSGGSDSKNYGQTLDNLNACILRIDVDRSSVDEFGKERAYSVPADNPFWQTPGARPEVWAYGLRNPWRLTFDRVSGHLWVGINGQDLWESAQLVKRGENYGWPIIEGSHDFHRHRSIGPTPIVMATVEHPHSEARSLTGGVVYHGKKLPLLRGAYIYGDFATGKIWAVRHDGQTVTWHQEIANTRLAITGFALDRSGELLIVDHGGGLYHLEPTPEEEQNTNFPTRLSETGLFADVTEHQLLPGVIPYSVNSPRWADHARMERYLGVPGDGQVTRSGRRAWKFPEGTVILQTLFLELEAGNPKSERRMETQMLTLQQGEWAGYSYRWNEAGTDAELVPATGAETEIVVATPQELHAERPQTWRFPSRTECTVCHNRAVDYVLGLTTTQLNKTQDYGGDSENQLSVWDRIGLLSETLGRKPSEFPRLVNPHDETAELDARAASYLHSNCHHCHVNEGGGNSLVNLEYGGVRSESQQEGGGERRGRGRRRRGGGLKGTIEMVPQHGTFGLDDASVVVAGHPERSVLFFRLAKLGQGRMPYAGSNVIDPKGLALIHDWIKYSEVSDGKTSAPIDQLNLLADLSVDKEDLCQTIDSLLSSTSGGVKTLWAMEQGQVSPANRKQVIERAALHPSESIRDLFERFLPPNQRVQRLGKRIEPTQILELQGNAAAGKALYFQSSGVQCKSCHMVGGEGGKMGPDLSSIGRKHNRAALLTEILEPSRKIEPEFATYRAVTDDGKFVIGLIVEQNDTEVVLQAAQGEPIRLLRENIEAFAADTVSLMPELLLQNLTAQQAADLLEFLSQQRASLP